MICTKVIISAFDKNYLQLADYTISKKKNCYTNDVFSKNSIVRFGIGIELYTTNDRF